MGRFRANVNIDIHADTRTYVVCMVCTVQQTTVLNGFLEAKLFLPLALPLHK